jgi:hypothetical protein
MHGHEGRGDRKMRVVLLLIGAVLLLAVGCTNQYAVERDRQDAQWRYEADQREYAWQMERARTEAEWRPICAQPATERIAEICYEHRMLMYSIDQRHRDYELQVLQRHTDSRERDLDFERRERQARAEAIQRAFTPPPPNPWLLAPRQATNCTSMVNGGLVTTSCY